MTLKNKDIIIFGASGQGKNVAQIIQDIGDWKILGFVDNDPDKKGQMIMGYPVIGKLEDVSLDRYHAAIAIGNPKIVRKVVDEIKASGKQVNFPNLIHPSAVVDLNRVKMGQGNVINGGCIFTTDVEIGDFNYFNRLTGLSHDCRMGSYCLIHSNVATSGDCEIGDYVQIGVGSTIIQGMKIGSNSVIGAGAVVIRDVDDNSVVVGNPAKELRKND